MIPWHESPFGLIIHHVDIGEAVAMIKRSIDDYPVVIIIGVPATHPF